ncbi:hypothetical protein ACN4EK_27580 [Pantanalinema rosaneae CENA516]|uniref:hypothetical protein n=1 Tax=Pantanalinema rosaneae TaxID=1620701 RepID=UPI003D6EED9E
MTQEPPPDPNRPEPAEHSLEPRQARPVSSSRRSPGRRRTTREPMSDPVPGGRRPFLIAQTVQILRSMIQTLESVVRRLETDPELTAPPSRGIGSQILVVIRAFLPRALSRRVSDPVLTGAIAGLVTLGVVAIVLPNWQPTPAPPPEVVTLPSPEVTPPPDAVPTPEATPTPEPEITPTPTPEETIATAPEASPVEPEPEPLPSEPPTPETEAPIVEPSPVVVEPEPPPPLTPEQQLVALIQTEVTKLSDPYQSGLIQTVEPDYRSSRLVIQLNPQWHELNQTQQRELANQLLQQAQELNFSKLELTDSAGTLLARSPVVGTEMVILRRSQSEPTTQPKAV